MIVKQCVLAVALFVQIYNVVAQEIPSLPTIFSDKFGFGGLNDQVFRKGLTNPSSPIFKIVTSQSNILSVNCFYPKQVQPTQAEFKWDQCAPLLDYTKQFPEKILRGHALLWPSN